jgi:hypothetical protein
MPETETADRDRIALQAQYSSYVTVTTGDASEKKQLRLVNRGVTDHATSQVPAAASTLVFMGMLDPIGSGAMKTHRHRQLSLSR